MAVASVFDQATENVPVACHVILSVAEAKACDRCGCACDEPRAVQTVGGGIGSGVSDADSQPAGVIRSSAFDDDLVPDAVDGGFSPDDRGQELVVPGEGSDRLADQVCVAADFVELHRVVLRYLDVRLGGAGLSHANSKLLVSEKCYILFKHK